MSKTVLKNAYCSLNSNVVSTDMVSVTLTYNAAALDSTAMGDNTKKNTGGLLDYSLQLEAFSDYAAAGLDSILFPLVGTTFAFEVRPDAGARSTSNPAFTGTVLLESYEPVSGQVGQMVKTKVSLKPASDLARQTS